MITALLAAKGGVGTSVVAALLAQALAVNGREVLLVDLGGDQPAIFGFDDPDGPGVSDWMTQGSASDAAALRRVEIDASDRLAVLPLGSEPDVRVGAAALITALREQSRDIIVDAGCLAGALGPGRAVRASVAAGADRRWLVTRACYLSLRRHQHQLDVTPEAVILLREPGRALGTTDVEAAIGAPVVLEIDIDPSIARSVDAGLLAKRPSRSLVRIVSRVW